MEHVEKWNTWIRRQKESCIKKSRANSTKVPEIHYDNLRNFFNTLTSLGILDANEDIIKNVQYAVSSILTKNPTL